MREKELQIDRNCHAIYTRQCRDVILKKVRAHYEEAEVDAVFERFLQRSGLCGY